MEHISELKPGIHYVGVNDRRTQYFEGLWTLPYGVSYNAYLVADQKTALIDSVDSGYTNRYLDAIADIAGERPIDYLVVNHMEPDHSGSIVALRRRYPEMQIIGNAKTLQMIKGFYGIGDRTIEVKDGDTLSLGALTLSFHLIPMVHWPETMVTYCPERKTLFSGDAFGTFGALNGGITDSQLSITHFWDEMRRYYACIVSKYGLPVQKALQKLAGIPLEMICSTHGPVWTEQIDRVIDMYERMSRHEGERGAVIAYGSMYGNTAQAAERIARELAERGVQPIVVHDLSTADSAAVLRDVHKYDTLVLGSPTYNGNVFPPVENLMRQLESRCVAPRTFAVFGGFTWAGTAVKQMKEFAARMKWDVIEESFEFKQGYDSASVAEHCRTLAEAIAAKMK